MRCKHSKSSSSPTMNNICRQHCLFTSWVIMSGFRGLTHPDQCIGWKWHNYHNVAIGPATSGAVERWNICILEYFMQQKNSPSAFFRICRLWEINFCVNWKYLWDVSLSPILFHTLHKFRCKYKYYYSKLELWYNDQA